MALTSITSPLILATHNAGKLREARELIAPLGVKLFSAGELRLLEPEENGASFEENACIKALAAARESGHMALADDSGLEVNALGGAPGIRSARWAGAAKDFRTAAKRIEQELHALGLEPEGQPARFVCVLCLAAPSNDAEYFHGEVRGRLTFPGRGEHGFGYDPIFVPDGHTRSFAEMRVEEKHALSHRARAFAALFARFASR